MHSFDLILTLTGGFAAALLHTGCTRSAAANAPRGAAEV